MFRHDTGDYDACIGNPPYVQHHYLERRWKDKTVATLEERLGIRLNKSGNLYLYFLCLGLLKARDDGLVGLVIPYEWISRPSAAAVRNYIQSHGWDVAVYRFQFPIFTGVLTTASISFIDKSGVGGSWSYFDVQPDYSIVPRSSVVEAPEGVLPYSARGAAWALRGLSPGSQKIFTLTEGQRIHLGLRRTDVVPCVTTLRHIPRTIKVLTTLAFERHFVTAGQKCWLIRSFAQRRSRQLDAYLSTVPRAARDNYTCNQRRPWFKFRPHPIPNLILASGFTRYGPKVVINKVGAHTVGAVFGVHLARGISSRRVQRCLYATNVEERVVPHAKTLKKLEVKQVNGLLNNLVRADDNHG